MNPPSRGDTPVVPKAVLARLRCPTCGGDVELDGDGVVCVNGHWMRFSNGYLDASPSEDLDRDTAETLASFGYEWTTFDAIQPEDESFWRRYFADVDLPALRGKVVLDAGCGKGRFSYFTAEHVDALVALDGSMAVHAAARNLAAYPNVVVIKSDVRQAPFADASFDFIFCLGVLHHLKDPEAGFKELVRMLTPGGHLLLYVYSRPERIGTRAVGLAVASWMRRVTPRVPRPLLRALSLPIASFLYVAFVLPGRIGSRMDLRWLAGLPLQTYRGRPLRSLWLDTFDRLSAPLERRFAWSDLSPWFTSAGLRILRVRDDAGFIVLACDTGGDDAANATGGRSIA